MEQLHMDAKRDFDHLARIKLFLFEKILEQLNQPIDYQGEDAATKLAEILNQSLVKFISKEELEKHGTDASLPIIYVLRHYSVGQVLQIPRAGWGSSTHSWQTISDVFEILGKSPPPHLLLLQKQNISKVRTDVDAVHKKVKQINEIIRSNIAALSGAWRQQEWAKVKKDIFEEIYAGLNAFLDFSGVIGKEAIDKLFEILSKPSVDLGNGQHITIWEALSVKRSWKNGKSLEYGKTGSTDAILKILKVLGEEEYTFDKIQERLELAGRSQQDSTPRSS